MKKYLAICCLLFCIGLGSCKQTDYNMFSAISGQVVDYHTEQGISKATVNLSPTGKNTMTDNSGHFEFTDLDALQYKVTVQKTGYKSNCKSIVVPAGETTDIIITLEKLPALKIFNDNGVEINELDFGEQEDDITRSFNIFNDGPRNLFWEITKTADWIINVSNFSGTLKPGKQQSIIVTISRNLLHNDNNVTILHVTSNDGTKDLKVKATKGNYKPYITLEADRLMVQKTDLGCVDYTNAASMCNNSTVGEFTDWRLPTIDELMVLYVNRDYIGGFNGNSYNYHYWSSTKSNGWNWNSWECVNFEDGSIYDCSDYYDNNVRAVRTYNGGGGGYISEWLYYDDGMMVDAIGTGGTIYWGVMFPASMMNEYAGTSMTKIMIFDYQAGAATINIYYGGLIAPGDLVHTQNFYFNGQGDWLEFNLTSPLPIDGTENVWVTFYQSGTDYPAAVSNDVSNDPNGRWISMDGISWLDLASQLPGYTLMIRAYVTNKTKGGKIIPLEPFKGKKAEGKITSIKSQ